MKRMTSPGTGPVRIHSATLRAAWQHVFAARSYRILALLTMLLFFLLSLYVPVWLIPANTLSLVLHLLHLYDLVVLILLAMASGFLLAINVFLIKRRVGATLVEGGFGVAAALSAAVLLTSCGCGLGLVVGIFGIGLGGAAFLSHYQFVISLLALAVVLVGLYISLRKVHAVCAV